MRTCSLLIASPSAGFLPRIAQRIKLPTSAWNSVAPLASSAAKARASQVVHTLKSLSSVALSPYGLGGLRLAALLGRFGVSLVKLVNVLTDKGCLKPLEELGGRIDLVVMLAVGEDSHLVQVFGKPGCILRDRDKANKPAAHRQVINILQRLARQSDGSIVDMNPRGSTE